MNSEFKLEAWKAERLLHDREAGIASPSRRDITAIAYAFGSAEKMPIYAEANLKSINLRSAQLTKLCNT